VDLKINILTGCFFEKVSFPHTMFSAIKRLAGKSDGIGNVSPRPAHQSMPTNLQRKFAKGVQYNSKFMHMYIYIVSSRIGH